MSIQGSGEGPKSILKQGSCLPMSHASFNQTKYIVINSERLEYFDRSPASKETVEKVVDYIKANGESLTRTEIESINDFSLSNPDALKGQRDILTSRKIVLWNEGQ